MSEYTDDVAADYWRYECELSRLHHESMKKPVDEIIEETETILEFAPIGLYRKENVDRAKSIIAFYKERGYITDKQKSALCYFINEHHDVECW